MREQAQNYSLVIAAFAARRDDNPNRHYRAAASRERMRAGDAAARWWRETETMPRWIPCLTAENH